MLVIPAIDIRGGACVRLLRGDPNQQTVYASDPVKMARLWEEQGAQRIHVVDLDGAFGGAPQHLGKVAEMKKQVRCEIEFGGGIRSKDSLQRALDIGIDKVILGTAAVNNADWVLEVLERHPGRLIVGLDAKDNQVTRDGWTENSALGIDEALAKMEKMGFRETIYTDISKDGTLEGPAFDSVRRVISKTKMGVYASGGVSKMDDILKLRDIPKLKGCIVGKALYAGTLSLKDCFAPEK